MAPRPETERREVDGSTTAPVTHFHEDASDSLPTLLMSEVEDEEVLSGVSVTGTLAEGLRDEGAEPELRKEAEVMLPPDGGWGWAVLFGTMIVNIVLIGHAKSFGVYFKTVMEEFDASPSRVAWIQSLQISMFSFLSPLASVLSQVVGPRKVALVGGVMACSGLTVSAMAPSLEFLYIFYGVVQGVAVTFTFTPGITMTAKYFYKRRGLANGLGMAGNALGGIIMPLVAHQLTAEYGLRGCFLIMGGLLLHSCVGVMLWQPVEWHQKKVKDDDQTEEDGSSEIATSQVKIQQPVGIVQSNSLYSKHSTSADEIVIRRAENGNCFSYPSNPELHVNNLILDDCVLTNGQMTKGGSSPHLGWISKTDEFYDSSQSTESLPVLHKISPRMLSLRQNSRTSSFIYLSTYNLGPTAGAILTKEHLMDEHTEGALMKKTVVPDVCDVTQKHNRRRKLLCPCLEKFVIDKTIFDKSRFYIMTVSLFFHVLGYPGTQIFLPYRATMLGLSQAHAASLLSVLALTDLVGRVSCAWISDFHFCPRKYWFIGGMFMSGVFALSLPYYRSYGSLLAGTAGFGFSCGAYIGLVVVLFADAFDSEKVALAYSISTVFGGFMALGGPPLMGYVLESTGSYAICQSILGSAQFAGAAVWAAEPWAFHWEQRRKEKKKKQAEEEALV